MSNLTEVQKEQLIQIFNSNIMYEPFGILSDPIFIEKLELKVREVVPDKLNGFSFTTKESDNSLVIEFVRYDGELHIATKFHITYNSATFEELI